MEKIITKEIQSTDFDSIRSYFNACLSESIGAIDKQDFEHLEWYADCSFDDYFTEIQEIWSENGEFLGNGFDMIFAKIILNDATRSILENLFEYAREFVYDQELENFASRAWEECKDYTPYDADDERATNFEKWCENGEMNSCFCNDVDGIVVYKIWENQERKQAINVFFCDDKIYRYNG